MMGPDEALRRTRNYKDIKISFEHNPAETLTIMKERFMAQNQLVDMYEQELKKSKDNKKLEENWQGGIKEIREAQKMIAGWVKKLKKDFPDYDFSIHKDILEM